MGPEVPPATLGGSSCCFLRELNRDQRDAWPWDLPHGGAGVEEGEQALAGRLDRKQEVSLESQLLRPPGKLL